VGEKGMHKAKDYIKEGISQGQQYFDSQTKKFNQMANSGN